MTTNAQRIAEWRAEHPGERIDGPRLRDLIGTETLGGADLRYANLRDASLWGADLRDASLRYADLRGADLRYANLRGANLWGALRIDGLPSGQLTLIPTPDGWDLRIGCWHGTPDALRTLIDSDEGWPEARGDEVARRRPLLAAALALIDAHTADRAQVIADLAAKWGTADEWRA